MGTFKAAIGIAGLTFGLSLVVSALIGVIILTLRVITSWFGRRQA